MMRNVSGKPGEMVVVISPELWKAASGQAIRDALAQSQIGLPQDEPLFSIINIPMEAYGDIFKTTRNIIEVNVTPSAEKTDIAYLHDVHAYTQAMVVINAKNQAELEQLIKDNTDKMIGFFLKAERERLVLNYSKYNDRAVKNKVEKHFGIDITVPPGFSVDVEKDSFMWLRYETPEISQAILIYTYPYTSDSTFTSNYILTKRNIVLMHNVPGPREGSYMTTNMELPVFFNTFKKDGNFAAEMRGLWETQNDYMGGPFVNLSILDLLRNRVVTLDGYVYAPSKDKRNLLRQVEAMIYSVSFTDQADIDKLNKQFE